MKKRNEPKKKAAAPPPFFRTKGILVGVIVIAIIASGIASLIATGNLGGTAAVPPQDCGRITISYMNANIAQAGSNATLTSVIERKGVYAISAQYQNRNITLYTTKDCTLLFTNTYNMQGTTTPAPTASPTPPPEPVKSDRPVADLYVMSFCPFGIQAENVMNPVIGLLGTKANIIVRYIATVQGTSIDSINSLHGPTEAREDLRQLCIEKYYPAQLWPYLMDFNTNCVSVRQNATSLAACETNTTRKVGIDNQKIESCAAGSEGIAMLKADGVLTTANGVTGSPTLLINGQRYSGARNPDAFKQGICSHFTTSPAECGVNLSSQAATTSGSCG